MLLDYALPVEAVMAEEAALDTPQARLEGFAEWARRNPEAWSALWAKAREMAWRHQYVSTNYLINWLRFDTYIRISGTDGRAFKAPNTYAAILGRYFKEDPSLAPYVRCNSSMYDGLELPEIGGKA